MTYIHVTCSPSFAQLSPFLSIMSTKTHKTHLTPVVHVCPRSVSCHSMNTTPKNNQAIHHPKPPQQTGPARQSGPARQTRPAAPPITGSSKPRSHSVPQVLAHILACYYPQRVPILTQGFRVVGHFQTILKSIWHHKVVSIHIVW